MNIITYPLNNIEYTAEDAELYHATRTSGVFANDDFPITVSGDGNVVTVGEGIGWIRNSKFSGKVVANKAEMSLDLGLPHATYPRIDAIVLQFNANSNASEIIVKSGTAQTSPTPPEVVRTESVYELHLYHVYRAAGAASVTASDVTDLRADASYCGLMADDVTMIGDDFVNKNTIGVANGVASLDGSGKVPAYQLPSMDYIPTSQKGAASGVATLDSNGKVPSDQLNLSSSVNSTSASTVANSAAVKAAYDKAVEATAVTTGTGTVADSGHNVISSVDVSAVNWKKLGKIVFATVDTLIFYSKIEISDKLGVVLPFRINNLPSMETGGCVANIRAVKIYRSNVVWQQMYAAYISRINNNNAYVDVNVLLPDFAYREENSVISSNPSAYEIEFDLTIIGVAK